MERLSLQGDFFDCQLYGGLLYLWTFNGSLQIYNYTAIIKEWLRLHENNHFGCHAYENDMSQAYISAVDLRRFLLYERDYLTDEFPTGTEILGGELYEANAKGLFGCKVPVFAKMMPVVKISDTPLVHVSGAKRRGLVCAGGSDGMFWMPSSNRQRGLVHVSDRQTIRASFCSPGIYAHSSASDSYLLIMNGELYGAVVREQELYPAAEVRGYGPKMTWSWNNNFFIAEEHKLKVYDFVSATEPMRLKDEIQFFYWKGDFVSAGSSMCGTVVELDNAICLFEDLQRKDGHCTIMGPVTRWRMYPRSISYSSHVHIIFDDRLDIVVMNDEVRRRMRLRGGHRAQKVAAIEAK